MQNEISQVNRVATSPNEFVNQDIETTNDQPGTAGAIQRLSIIFLHITRKMY